MKPKQRGAVVVGVLDGQELVAEVKSFKATIKSVDAKAGTFTAVVSVFGNVDYAGERMVKGAFTRTLSERGIPPIYWNHNWDAGPIGWSSKAAETDEGLEITAPLFTDYDLPGRIHQAMLAAMAAGSKVEFSFAYEVRASNEVTENGEKIVEITDVELYEVGPVVVGMNDATRLIEAASRRGSKQLAEPPAGSFEAIQEDLLEAVAAAEGSGFRVYLVATFSDSVVYQLYKLNGDGYIDWSSEPETFQRDYTRDETADTVTLGDRTAVDVVVTIVPSAEKAGRWTQLKHANAPTHIQSAHDALVRAGAKCADSGEDDSKSRDADATIEGTRRRAQMMTRRQHEEPREATG